MPDVVNAPITITPNTITAPVTIGAWGKSAYQSYLATTADDPVLSESAWVASLEGPPGADGAPGPNSVTSSTSSDGTADISLASVTTPTIQAAGEAGVEIKNADGESLLRVGVNHLGGSNKGVAFGEISIASGLYSFATGANTRATGYCSFASGANTTASGAYSHTSGQVNTASGEYSVASGESCTASGEYSHAGGHRAKAIHDGTFVRTDSQDADCESTLADQATFRFLNGYRFLGGAAVFSGNVSGSNLSGTNTGDETAQRIGTLISNADSKATPVDADTIAISDSAATNILKRLTFANLKTWLGTWLDAVATIAGAKTASGAWSFTSTTRPTSSGTGEPASNSLILRSDKWLLDALGITRTRRMMAPGALSSTGTWTNTISNGTLTNCFSSTVASAGGARLMDSNESWAFSKPVTMAVCGRLMPSATSSNCVARVFVGNTGGTIGLADAANVVTKAGYGFEIYASGGGYRARMFFCSADGAAVSYSGTGTGTGTVAIADGTSSPMLGYVLENDGAGNLALRANAQSVTAANSDVGSTILTWTGAISNTALTYTPAVSAIGATPSVSISGGVGVSVYAAVMKI